MENETVPFILVWNAFVEEAKRICPMSLKVLEYSGYVFDRYLKYSIVSSCDFKTAS